ncbi:MAG: DNA-binding response regulator [Nitriliruptor sp.]|nr:MAG: DNA-binding response regulator [Nitriliruptor sp.]
MTIRVVIADDQHLVRAGFAMILGEEPDLEVVGEAADGLAAIEVVQRLAPDVVLMDIRMPHLDGLEALRRLVAAGTSARVIVLTTFDADEYVFSALRGGASGFLLKDTPPTELVSAVRTVAGGEALLDPTVTQRVVTAFVEGVVETGGRRPPPELASLTDREREVLTHLARGRSNAEIATLLVVSETTIKTHVGRVLAKLRLRDRVQAVVYAYEHGVVRPGVVEPPPS